MIKQAPSIGRIVAMVVFALSCVGILIFLWLAFGGSIPLRPESYRVTIPFKEATTLAVEADVRMAGVNVGKVKSKKLDKRGARTDVEIELKPHYAPIPKDSHAILRQKTLLGETYVQIAPGHKSAGMLADGGTLARSRVEPTVELDEIFSAFDRPTRSAFREWVAELRKASSGKAAESLNDALGNLAGFSADGAKLFRTLDEQHVAVRRLIRNTGEVFAAVNERQGALRQLIVNSNHVFQATASEDEALADTFEIFPTFLDESKATLARLERFSRNTHPLVNDLKRPAGDLGPTIRDLGDLSPDLERLFRSLPPLISTSRTTVPDLRRVLGGAEPVLESLSPWLDQVNPILSYFNFHQATIAGFFSNAAADLKPDKATGEAKQTQIAMIEPRTFQRFRSIPSWARGNSYMAPNALTRAIALGAFESFNCPGGQRRDPVDSGSGKQPPCFNAPPSLYSGKVFNRIREGRAPKVDAPQGNEGTRAADPNRR